MENQLTVQANPPLIAQRIALTAIFLVLAVSVGASEVPSRDTQAASLQGQPSAGRPGEVNYRHLLDLTYGYGRDAAKSLPARLTQMKEAATVWQELDDRGEIADCAVFYYGLGMKPEQRRAFRCLSRGAYSLNGEDDRILLAIQYWNGEGVAQDRKKAKQIFSEVDQDRTLNDTKVLPLINERNPAPIKFCPDLALVQRDFNFCRLIEATQAEWNDLAQLDGVLNSLDPKARASMGEVLRLFARFVTTEDSFAGGEYAGGTIRGAIESSTKNELYHELMDYTASWIQNKGNSNSSQQGLDRAEEALSGQYKKLINESGTDSSALKATENAWIRYREAFVGLAKSLYADANQAMAVEISVRTRFAQDRTRRLGQYGTH